MEKRYFVDSSDGFAVYTTEQEALDAANAELTYLRKEAMYDGEWPDEAAHITYGVILGKSTPIEHEGEDGEESGYDYQIVKYD